VLGCSAGAAGLEGIGELGAAHMCDSGDLLLCDHCSVCCGHDIKNMIHATHIIIKTNRPYDQNFFFVSVTLNCVVGMSTRAF